MPIVNAILFCVARVPSAVKYAEVPLRPDDTEATGVPVPDIFNTANFAEAVEVPPIKRSTVLILGYNAPFV